jgi:hypothetical protein
MNIPTRPAIIRKNHESWGEFENRLINLINARCDCPQSNPYPYSNEAFMNRLYYRSRTLGRSNKRITKRKYIPVGWYCQHCNRVLLNGEIEATYEIYNEFIGQKRLQQK